MKTRNLHIVELKTNECDIIQKKKKYEDIGNITQTKYEDIDNITQLLSNRGQKLA